MRNTALVSGGIAIAPSISLTSCGNKEKRFTILHTNDLHSNLVGVGPLSDYDPLTTDNDETIGGFSRLAAWIESRKKEMEQYGPVLVLDAGDFSMGTAFGAASRELGAELQLLAQMGYDATTIGNHEFDLGPDGLGTAINKALEYGPIPTMVVSNSNFGGDNPRLEALSKLVEDQQIVKYKVIERGGIRFGLLGFLGYDAIKYSMDPGGTEFDDPIESANEIAGVLRNQEKVDVVIALSHGGVQTDDSGEYSGEDVELLSQVADIDIIIGAHTHTAIREAKMIDGRPIVQTGKYGENLGELSMRLEEGRVVLESYRLIPMDDSLPGNVDIHQKVSGFLESSSAAVFASRGYSVTQPLAIIDQDWPMVYRDKELSTPLANLVADAFHKACETDVALTASGLIRTGLLKGNTGIQSVYDIFSLTPLGNGVVDDTAGSAMVSAHFTGFELKNILNFFLLDDPIQVGQYFPRTSGMRFTYDPNAPKLNMVRSIELGNLQDGYREIDISESAEELYSLCTPLYAGLILVAIPKLTKGALEVIPKNQDGTPIETRSEALVDPRSSRSPYILKPDGAIDSKATVTSQAQQEIKEWQAIMDYLRDLPDKNADGISILKMDEHAKEVRAIEV